MKKFKIKKIVSLLLTLIIFTSYISPVFADNDDNDNNDEYVDNAVDVNLSNVQIGDQFKDSEGITYTVSDDAANIYVGSGDNQKHYETGDVETFEITYETLNGNATFGDKQTWRKYIKLEDLCDLTKEDGTHICEIMDNTDKDGGEFYLKRLYKDKINESVYNNDDNKNDIREISLYYYSYHATGTKEFNSMLVLRDEDKDIDVDTYSFTGSDEKLEEAGKWTDEGYMTTDIETLIDNNGDVFVSLRFVSESLGAEVRWVDVGDSKDGSDDDVYIEFYDDKEYCKGIEYNFYDDNHDIITPEEMEKSLYLKETVMQNISLDGTYQYKDVNNEVHTSDVDWPKIYLLLKSPDTYPDGFFDTNVSLENRIMWIDEEDDNYLWVKSYVYGKYSDGQCTIGNNSYDCDLGEEVNITGIILYKGVPVPIDLFNINDEKCVDND